MTWIHTYEKNMIELALERMREDGIVWQRATVKGDAPQFPRGEAAEVELDCLSHPSGSQEKVKPVRSASRCRPR
mgnify:CR=1 FL=1